MNRTARDCIITLDIGTSSLRAVVFSFDGERLYGSQFTYSPSFLANDRVEQNPADWDAGIIQTLRDVAGYISEAGLSVSALSVTSQRASVIPLDARGDILHPAIMWQDKRSVGACSRLGEELSERFIYDTTGLRIDSYFSGPKIRWLHDKEKDIFRTVAKFLGVQDYVVYRLTGDYVTDASQASRTMLMDVTQRRWSSELLQAVGVQESQLPRIVEPGTVCGVVSDSVAGKTGLPYGIPLVLAGGDQQCAAIALGVLDEGIAVANVGTGAFILASAERPVFDPEAKTLCSVAALPGSWIVEAGLLTGGILLQWFVEQFFREYPAEVALDHVFEEISETQAGSGGVILLPHFKGSAAPHWNQKATGVFFNITMSTTRGDMARAVLEGICLEMAENLSLIERNIGPLSRIAISGGMTRNALFNHMLADSFNRSVLHHESSIEATSLGAWMSALVASGGASSYLQALNIMRAERPAVFSPDAVTAGLYAAVREKRNILYETLKRGNVYGP